MPRYQIKLQLENKYRYLKRLMISDVVGFPNTINKGEMLCVGEGDQRLNVLVEMVEHNLSEKYSQLFVKREINTSSKDIFEEEAKSLADLLNSLI